MHKIITLPVSSKQLNIYCFEFKRKSKLNKINKNFDCFFGKQIITFNIIFWQRKQENYLRIFHSTDIIYDDFQQKLANRIKYLFD